ncbi:MAG: Fur family transcriptional regulator [Acidaminococcaceae bacterium]|nr:Fur family transcriptional regulator [Acidaminococcaceae bacterium]MDD4721621.1 Fur family transcriptional regulator [Acidaminococcaceae bacterium]
MVEDNLDYKEYLKEHGLKSTKQRNLLLTLLHEASTFATAEDLYFKAKQADDTISLSTIYRILELFNKKNIINKTTLLEEAKAVFELKPIAHRHHLICLGCKKIIDIDHCPLESFEKKLEATTDFSIVDHKLELYGYCKECKNNIPKKS